MAKVKVKGQKTIADPMGFLSDTGLLFHLNCTVFHPLGLAVTAKVDPENGCLSFCELLDYRHNPRLAFTPEDFAAGRDKLARFLADEGNAIMARRRKLLGYVTQKS